MAEFTEFDIKKGCYKNVDGDGLKNVMAEVFGKAEQKGDTVCSSYGVMAKIEAKVVSKSLLGVRTENIPDTSGLSDEEIIDSKRKLNDFLFKTTGFTAKDRQKRAKDKAKKGEL